MKALIKFLIIIGVICLTIVIGAVFFIANLDPNDYKDKIAIKLSDELNRPVTIQGDINASFYPWLGVDVGKVAIANAKGFNEEKHFLKANHLKVRTKLMPLFRKEIEMDTLDIDGVEVYLEKNAKGISNWEDLVAEKEDQHKHKGSSHPPELGALILGGVKITNANVTYVDAETGQNVFVKNITATTGELEYGKPIELNVSMLAEANKPALKSDIKLDGVLNYNLDTEVYQLTPLNLTADTTGKSIPGGKTTIKLIGDVISDQNLGETQLNIKEFDAIGTKANMNISITGKNDPVIAGTTSINSEDISKLFKAFAIEPLASELAKQKTRSINSNVSFNSQPESGNLNITELNANLMGNQVQGNVQASNLHKGAGAFKGVLNAKGPNLPVLLQLIGQIQEGKESGLAKIGKDLAKSKQKSFELSTEFDVDLASGNINMPAFTASGLGLKANGSIQGNKGNLQGSFKVAGEEPKDLLTALGQGDLAKVVKRIDLNTNISGNDSALSLKPLALTVSLSGKQIPNSPVSVKLNADTDVNMKKETLSLPRFSVQGLGLNINGNLSAKNYSSENISLNGQLNIAEFNLKQLAKQLSQDLPNTTDKNVFNKVALSTGFAKSKGIMQVNDLKMRLDDSNINGSLSFSDNPQTATKFALNIDQIDADRYFPPSTEGKPKTPEAAAGAAVQFPVETLRAHNFQGDVKIGKFIASKAKMQDVNLSVKANFGDIRMHPMTAKLYEGSYSADIKLNAKGSVPTLNIITNLNGIQAEPMLLDTTGQANLVGKGSFNANLSGQGANTQQLISSLSGNADLNFTDGILRGVDVGGALKQVELMIEQKRFGNIDKGEQTVFDSLVGTMQVQNGVVTNNDMLMTAPGFTVPGEGMLVNLNDETWKYNLVVKVDKTYQEEGSESYNLGGYDLPINCRGKIKDFNCKPDAGGIAKLVLKTIGEDKVKDLVNDLIGDKLPINIFGDKEESKAPQEAAPAEAPTQEQAAEPTQQQQEAQPAQETKSPEELLKEKAAEELFKGLKKLF